MSHPATDTAPAEIATEPGLDGLGEHGLTDPAGAAPDVAPADEDGTPVSPARPAPPTREEMRQRVMAALDSGSTTIEAVVADMYASMYATEQQIRQLVAFLDRFAGSGLGKRLMGRSRKQAEKMAAEIEAEFGGET